MPEIIERNINTPITNKPKRIRYKMNDLGSVYIHYDPKTGRNIATENKLTGDENNGKSSK